MTKRQLNEDEKKFMQKKIDNINANYDLLVGEIKNMEFKIDFQLEHSYKKMLAETQEELRKLKQVKVQSDETLKVLKDQIENGVEKKEAVEDGKEN